LQTKFIKLAQSLGDIVGLDNQAVKTVKNIGCSPCKPLQHFTFVVHGKHPLLEINSNAEGGADQMVDREIASKMLRGLNIG
jgi:hypothetical protein